MTRTRTSAKVWTRSVVVQAVLGLLETLDPRLYAPSWSLTDDRDDVPPRGLEEDAHRVEALRRQIPRQHRVVPRRLKPHEGPIRCRSFAHAALEMPTTVCTGIQKTSLRPT